MESLIKKLGDSGLLENTVIAISADHYPYGLSTNEISELKGHQVEKNFELYENTFLIWNKGMKPVTVDKAACSMYFGSLCRKFDNQRKKADTCFSFFFSYIY